MGQFPYPARIAGPLLPVALLSACASFSGQQRTLQAGDLTSGYAQLVSADLDAKAYTENTDQDIKKAKRNVVVLKFMLAVDERYDNFTANLSRELRGSNLGFDLGVLALTGIGSVVSNAAPELSAGATALGGARASINKELYLERTLPAILVVMDANRLRIRTSIQQHMRLAAAEYSLDEAMLEVREYERAGNLNRAITDLTSQASVAFAAAEKAYADSKASCEPPASLRPLRAAITNGLNAVQRNLTSSGFAAIQSADDQALGRVAAFMAARNLNPSAKATTADQFQSQKAAIANFLLATCTLDETNQAKTAILGG